MGKRWEIFRLPPTLTLTDFPITALTLDAAGHLWLGTDGAGILRLTKGDLNQAHWEAFTTKEGRLPSNKVQVVYAGQEGWVWIGTTGGLSRFDGAVWQIMSIPSLSPETAITALLEDAQGQLWVGAAGQVHHWNGQNWTTFEAASGWLLDNSDVTVLFEDSRGGLWAGTARNVQRFDGKS